MGKDKRNILKVLALFAMLLFASCDILETRKSYLDTVVENYWNDWRISGNDSLNCYIDFASAVDFDWDTMLYFSGEYYLYDYVKNDSAIKKYADLYAKHSSDDQLIFFYVGIV